MERDQKSLLEIVEGGFSIKRRIKLRELNIRITTGDFTGIYGLNGSGKSLLAELLAGNLTLTAGRAVKRPGLRSAVVSSAERKRMLEEDRHNDDSEFMEGRVDPGRSVNDILKSAGNTPAVDYADELISKFEIRHILNRGIRFLSTGEFRKMMIVRALLSKPDIIILDDPYTGLDIGTRRKLEGLIGEIRKSVEAVVLLSGRLDDLNGTKRLYFLNDGSLSESGRDCIKKMLAQEPPVLKTPSGGPGRSGAAETDDSRELIRMSAVRMHFYDEIIISDINWIVKSGEHWQITGPNGSGKSSLLSLITGDSPKAYGQELYLFGRKRGTGETVWEIKQKIGLVSGTLQREHRISQNVLSVVVSGFFDTVGLYDRPDPVQVEKARGWCGEFGIEHLLETPFDSLSEGMKRAVLIIRAVVKRPELLILDEPCQGLDDHNSDSVLNAVRRVISRDHSTLLYVSHDPDYRMEEINRVFELVPHAQGGYTGRSV